LQMIQGIGEITGKAPEATAMITKIKNGFDAIAQQQKRKYKTAYLIWKDPYMAAGGDTFINDMLVLSGFQNILADQTRYPEITIEQLKEKHTELALLSSEPYPFKQKHIEEIRAALPEVKIILADGEIFSWYGSRMQYAAGYINELWERIENEY
jgi:ABC-type Fe3+-hydroxamate transport system substrate-binding protein